MAKIILLAIAFLSRAAPASPEQLPAALEDLEIIGEVDSGWEYLLLQKQSCTLQDECELYERAIKDSYLRILYYEIGITGESEAESFFAVAPTVDQISTWVRLSDRSNRNWLGSRVEREGWCKISEYGEHADLAAFLMVQHSDFDRNFQREMLSLLETLLEERETRPTSWAMLHDRVSVADGLPQWFGSQGRCVGKNVWEPWEVEDHETLDALRADYDLMPMSAYQMRLNDRCATFSARTE